MALKIVVAFLLYLTPLIFAVVCLLMVIGLAALSSPVGEKIVSKKAPPANPEPNETDRFAVCHVYFHEEASSSLRK